MFIFEVVVSCCTESDTGEQGLRIWLMRRHQSAAACAGGHPARLRQRRANRHPRAAARQPQGPGGVPAGHGGHRGSCWPLERPARQPPTRPSCTCCWVCRCNHRWAPCQHSGRCAARSRRCWQTPASLRTASQPWAATRRQLAGTLPRRLAPQVEACLASVDRAVAAVGSRSNEIRGSRAAADGAATAKTMAAAAAQEAADELLVGVSCARMELLQLRASECILSACASCQHGCLFQKVQMTMVLSTQTIANLQDYRDLHSFNHDRLPHSRLLPLHREEEAAAAPAAGAGPSKAARKRARRKAEAATAAAAAAASAGQAAAQRPADCAAASAATPAASSAAGAPSAHESEASQPANGAVSGGDAAAAEPGSALPAAVQALSMQPGDQIHAVGASAAVAEDWMLCPLSKVSDVELRTLWPRITGDCGAFKFYLEVPLVTQQRLHCSRVFQSD